MWLAFGLGLLWMILIGIQTKLLVVKHSEGVLFIWVLATSLIWGYLVRIIVLDIEKILPYAIGTALGAIIARRISQRWN
jgi:hypothetical protein